MGSVRLKAEPHSSNVSYDGENWVDITLDGFAAILKAYTLKDDTIIINNNNIS